MGQVVKQNKFQHDVSIMYNELYIWEQFFFFLPKYNFKRMKSTLSVLFKYNFVMVGDGAKF